MIKRKMYIKEKKADRVRPNIMYAVLWEGGGVKDFEGFERFCNRVYGERARSDKKCYVTLIEEERGKREGASGR